MTCELPEYLYVPFLAWFLAPMSFLSFPPFVFSWPTYVTPWPALTGPWDILEVQEAFN